MSLLEKITALGKNSQSNVLNSILEELQKLNKKDEKLFYKEWYPLAFQFYVKGYYVNDPEFGTNKWGFVKLDLDDLKLDFDYEIHSLYAHTENRQYNASFKLILDGKSYPNVERIASEYSQYTDWKEYTGHNYCYQRSYRFARIWLYQSNHGHGEYPFIMTMKAPWTLNFEIFQTTTSYYWHFLQIQGWKLHPIEKESLEDLVSDLEELTK